MSSESLQLGLLGSGTYLADPLLPESVMWVESERGNVLVPRDAPTMPAYDTPDGVAPSVPNPVALSVVLKVLTDRYHMNELPYTGPNIAAATCGDVKGNAQFGNAHETRWANDFSTSVENINEIQRQIAQPLTATRSLITNNSIKLSHLYFRVRIRLHALHLINFVFVNRN